MERRSRERQGGWVKLVQIRWSWGGQSHSSCGDGFVTGTESVVSFLEAPVLVVGRKDKVIAAVPI